jgi:hypothetical protein
MIETPRESLISFVFFCFVDGTRREKCRTMRLYYEKLLSAEPIYQQTLIGLGLGAGFPSRAAAPTVMPRSGNGAASLPCRGARCAGEAADRLALALILFISVRNKKIPYSPLIAPKSASGEQGLVADRWLALRLERLRRV